MDSNMDNPPNDVSVVLAPSAQKNKDANRNGEVSAAAGTPVAKKTRGASLRLMNATSEMESPTGTTGNPRPTAETPRRSCRKSVRPTIDYDDIIVRSAKKVIAESLAADPEDEEPSTQKWSAAEVGRNSRKRSRKSKRMTTKKKKMEHEVLEVRVEEEQELEQGVLEEKEEDKQKTDLEVPQDQADTFKVETDNIEKVDKPPSKRKSSRASKNVTKFKCIVAKTDIDELGLCPLGADSQEVDDTETTKTASQDNDEDKVVKDEKKDDKIEEKVEKFNVLAGKDEVTEKAVEDNVHEETVPEEEMPSLLMENDDLDEPDKSPLNTTFDADEKKDLDVSVILVVDPVKQPEDIDASVIIVDSPNKPSVCVPKPEFVKKSAIKVVLTTENDQNETILDLADLAVPEELKPKKPKGFRFPTPYKQKPVLMFSDKSDKFDQTFKGLNKEEGPKYERKRSKSANDWNDNMSCSVTFQRSVEIANVEDIDKRWKGLQKTNVNLRRRRSKSLDESRCKVSRIPKPSRGIIQLTRTITPSKVNKRTKMPNFAAMHEKQFAKMESLLDHVERKAERAKVLTNSVQKQLPGSTVKKPPQGHTSEEDRPRPKALKQIDMSANRTIVKDHIAEKLNTSRLPLKTTAPALNVAPKPAFNLSTSTVKTFNATFTGRPAESQDNKLAERRQRRIEMFKGRTTTKAQNEKGNFIRGVRLNRRFELQMQHRRHLEED
uniref:Uncharacterized protein LOC108046671 isoform X2 n=1 Tax=Drosophila rhopaloa TaxID=1041015 RepID=A0A6P4F9A4_DRORH